MPEIDTVYLKNRKTSNLLSLESWADNYTRMKESEAYEPGPASELLGAKLTPEEEKGTWGEVKKSFKDVTAGYRQWAASFYNGIANIPGLINSAATKLAEMTGGHKEESIGRAFTEVEKELRTLAQKIAPTPEELQDRDSFISALYRAIGQAPGTILEYATGTKALGTPIGAFALIDAIKSADKGAVESFLAAIRGAVMGTGLKAIHGMGLGRIGAGASTGGLFGGLTAIEGGEPQETAVSTIVGLGLGTGSGKGWKPIQTTDGKTVYVPETVVGRKEIEAGKGFKAEPTGDLFQAEKVAERARLGDIRPEYLRWAAGTLKEGKEVSYRGQPVTLEKVETVSTPQGEKPHIVTFTFAGKQIRTTANDVEPLAKAPKTAIVEPAKAGAKAKEEAEFEEFSRGFDEVLADVKTVLDIGERGEFSWKKKGAGEIPTGAPLTPEQIKAREEAINRLKRDAGKLGSTIGDYLARRGIDKETIQKILAELPQEDREKKFGPYKERIVTVTDATKTAMDEFIKKSDEDIPLEPKPLGYGFNLENWETVNDVKMAVDRLAHIYEEKIQSARRGTRTHEQMQADAKKEGLTLEQLLAREAGEVWNDSRTLAARGLGVGVIEDYLNDINTYKNTGRPDSMKPGLLKKTQIAMEVIAQEYGLAAESGRSLNQFAIDATGEVQFLSEVKGGMERIKTGMSFDQLVDVMSVLKRPDQFKQLAKQAAKPNTKDILFWVLYNAMLSGPKTHIANLSGNLGMLGILIEERGIAGNAPWRSKEGVVPGEASAMLGAITANYANALRLAGKVFKAKTPEEIEQMVGPIKIEMRKVPIGAESFGFDPNTTHGRALDFLFNVSPIKALVAEDAFFKVMAFEAEKAALALREATHVGLKGDALAKRIEEIQRDPPEHIIEKAKEFANYATFTKELGEKGKAIERIASSSIFAKIHLPFVVTPINIAKVSLERFPGLNIIMSEYRNELATPGASRDLALAKMANGIMIMTVGLAMAEAGLLTGYGDRKTRKVSMEGGYQPYSFKVNNEYYGFNRFDPFGMWLGACADIVQIMKNAKDLDEEDSLYEKVKQLFAGGAVSMSLNFVSKAWMQTVSDFFDMMHGIKTDPLRSIEEFYRERVSMFIPVIVKEIRREIDPVIREVNSLADEIINSLPGQSDKLPARRTLLRGEPIPARESIGPNWLSPLTLSEDKNDPIVKEIENNKISIPDFPRWIGRRGSESVLEKERPIWGIKLEPKQRERLAVIMTQEIKVGEKNLYDYLTALIKSESYKNASGGPDGMKAQRIQGVFSVFRERAIDEIQKEIPEIRQRLENKIKERQKALRGASQ